MLDVGCNFSVIWSCVDHHLRSFLPIWLVHRQIPIAHNLDARVLRVGGEAPAKSPQINYELSLGQATQLLQQKTQDYGEIVGFLSPPSGSHETD